LFVLTLPAVAPALRAQSYAASSLLSEEIYVAAFYRSATEWCTAGASDALIEARASAGRIVQRSLVGAEQAAVISALDSSYFGILRRGGCAALARPLRLVIVNGFHGRPWDTAMDSIIKSDSGERESDGIQTVTTRVEIGPSPFERFPALADYTFSGEGKLISGRYRVPVREGAFELRWSQLENMLLDNYSGLRVRRQRTSAGLGGATVSAASAGGTAYGAWRSSFRNPDTRAIEVEMYATRGGNGEMVIVVDYRGYFQK
jgi:hypothetical protein